MIRPRVSAVAVLQRIRGGHGKEYAESVGEEGVMGMCIVYGEIV